MICVICGQNRLGGWFCASAIVSSLGVFELQPEELEGRLAAGSDELVKPVPLGPPGFTDLRPDDVGRRQQLLLP